MSKFISSDEESAYERWELPNVDNERYSGMLTAGQIEKIQKAAYEEGFLKGK